MSGQGGGTQGRAEGDGQTKGEARQMDGGTVRRREEGGKRTTRQKQDGGRGAGRGLGMESHEVKESVQALRQSGRINRGGPADPRRCGESCVSDHRYCDSLRPNATPVRVHTPGKVRVTVI